MNEDVQRTWLDAFAPPERLVGHTAVFVTMSADVDVLECVMERFSGLAFEPRRRQARVQAYLLRDSRNWQRTARQGVLTAQEVPGLFELSPRSEARLLHAKLAILSFGPRHAAEPTWLRLVVGTGNYTGASAKRLLELVFTTDTYYQGGEGSQALADLIEAARFVRALVRTRYLTVRETPSQAANPLAPFDQLIGRLAARRLSGVSSRFFHSLEQSMWSQLEQRISDQVPKRRDLLICGSGFYERVRPEVPEAEVLREIGAHRHLSAGTSRYLVAQPDISGQLRPWLDGEGSDEWQPALHAVDPQTVAHHCVRSLHAKFILIGRAEEYRRKLSVRGGYLYLGSANLTKRGLLLGPSRTSGKQGNIECGVFFAIGQDLDESALRTRLFFDRSALVRDDQWDTLDTTKLDLEPPPIEPCPLLYVAEEGNNELFLAWSAEAQEPLTLQLAEGHMLTVSPDQTRVLLPVPLKAASIAVTSADDKHLWNISVIDPRGRYAYEPPRISSLESLLAFFENTSSENESEEEPEDDEPDSGAERGRGQRRPASVIEKNYPLMQAAKLLEQIARAQERIEPPEIDYWLGRLEQLCDLRPDEPVLELLRSWKVDVFQHLAEDALAPARMSPTQQARYRQLLDEMPREWGLR